MAHNEKDFTTCDDRSMCLSEQRRMERPPSEDQGATPVEPPREIGSYASFAWLAIR